MLASYPKSGKRAVGVDPTGRCPILDNYLIYYRERKTHIRITHIFNGKQDQVKAGIGDTKHRADLIQLSRAP